MQIRLGLYSTVGFYIHIEMIGGFVSSRLKICQKCYEMSHYVRHWDSWPYQEQK